MSSTVGGSNFLAMLKTFERSSLTDFETIYFYLLSDAFKSKMESAVVQTQTYLASEDLDVPHPSLVVHLPDNDSIESKHKNLFFLRIIDAEDFGNESKHKEADTQMRAMFEAHQNDFAVPTIHAICAFGENICFYQYDRSTRRIIPENVSQANFFNVMEEDGFKKLHEIAHVVVQMADVNSAW
ncbi:hypothetical protein BDQ17DRAFT_1326501 [Cyathus striatus]|nr:hypothetical protein BDQ17DRAFT_1326501 [Cyathus striatus]